MLLYRIHATSIKMIIILLYIMSFDEGVLYILNAFESFDTNHISEPILIVSSSPFLLRNLQQDCNLYHER